MKKIGLVAGGGELPIEFIRAAKKNGEIVVVFAINDMALPQIGEEADKIYWVGIGQIGRFGFLLLKERIKRLAFLGRIKKNVIYNTKIYDEEVKSSLKKMRNKKDNTIFEEITKRLNMAGIEVIKGTDYLSHLLPQRGILSKKSPDTHIEEDIMFGYEIAKKIAAMDIGQTVIIKDKAVVAIEAMEGTDAVIQRAGKIAGKSCVMVKVSRPNQDLRWDIPTVGSSTMRLLSENGFSALAIESGKMFILEKEEMVRIADSQGIVFQVL